MQSKRRGVRWVVVLGCTLLTGLFTGCRSEARRQPATAASAPAGPPDAISTLSHSDGQRAQEALADNQREMSGQRRPYQPARPPVIDQPVMRR